MSRTSEQKFRSVSRRLCEVEYMVMNSNKDGEQLLESVRETMEQARNFYGPLIANEIEIQEWSKSELCKQQ